MRRLRFFLLMLIPATIYIFRFLTNPYPYELLSSYELLSFYWLYTACVSQFCTVIIGGGIVLIIIIEMGLTTQRRRLLYETAFFIMSLFIVLRAPVPLAPEQAHFYQHKDEYIRAVELARSSADAALPFNGHDYTRSLMITSFTLVFNPLSTFGRVIYTEDRANLDGVRCFPYRGNGSGTGLSGRLWAELDQNWYLCYNDFDF